MTDTEFLQAQIRGLENEVRELRETLRDRFALAAMQGLIAYYGDTSYISDADSAIRLHSAAYDHADEMLHARKGGNGP